MTVCLDDSILPFLPFLNGRQQIGHYLSGVSEWIYIPNGFPFGLQTHTVAYVSYFNFCFYDVY